MRADFPALQNRCYLDTATYGQLPRQTAEAVTTHLLRRDRTASSDFLKWFDDLEQVRSAVGSLIGASADDIAFITNAGQGLALFLNGIEWRDGDEIVTLENEFPNQLYAAASRLGVQGVVCRLDELERTIGERTRLVLLSTVNYRTGLRPDLGPLIRSLRARGVLTYVDGTQSVGALGLDCSSIQPDVLAVDAYKWMISPNGAGFVYVRDEVREWLRPNVVGWRSDREWRQVESLHQGTPRFSARAEKYEGGMLAFPSLYGMKASVDLMLSIGRDVIENRVLELAGQIRRGLEALGAEIFEGDAAALPSQILLMKLPRVPSSELARHLREQDIYISARRDYLRISPHFYNDEGDVDVLIAAVKEYAAR